LLSASAAGAGPAAADLADFSGTWVLNVYRSDLAGERPPRANCRRSSRGAELVVTIDEIDERGPSTASPATTTGGEDVVNDVLGNAMTSSISWDGAVMVMRTWGRFGNADIVLVDRWSLSPTEKR